MAIERLNDDLNFISALADEPNDSDGISASELKAKFDAAGNIIKNYINDSLVPGIEREIVSEVSGTAVKSGNMPASGLAGQLLAKKSDEDFDWEFVTPREMPSGGAPGHVLSKISEADFDTAFRPLYTGKWALLNSFLEPGAFVWTVPDHRGDAMPYEIGVFIVGAGGSGALAASPGNLYVAAAGGAGGYTRALRLTAVPGDEYNLVVGAGGTGHRIENIGTNTSSNYRYYGSSGGTSSFAGYTAYGGDGGMSFVSNNANTYGVPGADGGQGSDAAIANQSALSGNNLQKFHFTAPSRGMDASPAVYMTTSSVSYVAMFPGGRTIPGMCFNPFSGEFLLAAGGGSGVFTAGWYQQGYTFEDGTYSGTAVWKQAGFPGNAIALPATGVGCGGGACASKDVPSITVAAGDGGPGGVFIYVREAV